jgi:hypothetical protein
MAMRQKYDQIGKTVSFQALPCTVEQICLMGNDPSGSDRFIYLEFNSNGRPVPVTLSVEEMLDLKHSLDRLVGQCPELLARDTNDR